MNIYPTSINPSRQCHFNAADWTVAGYPEADAQEYLDSISQSYDHPNRIVDLRIPGQGKYWIAAEDVWNRAVSGSSRHSKRSTTPPLPGRRSPTATAASRR